MVSKIPNQGRPGPSEDAAAKFKDTIKVWPCFGLFSIGPNPYFPSSFKKNTARPPLHCCQLIDIATFPVVERENRDSDEAAAACISSHRAEQLIEHESHMCKSSTDPS